MTKWGSLVPVVINISGEMLGGACLAACMSEWLSTTQEAAAGFARTLQIYRRAGVGFHTEVFML